MDLARGLLETLSIDATPTHLLRTEDDIVVAFTDDGTRWLRLSARTRYDNLPATLSVDDLALDGPGRFVVTDALTLHANVTDARADVPSVTFVDVEVSAEITGTLDVLFIGELGMARVTVTPDRVGLPLCEIARNEGERLEIVRGEDDVRITAGDERLTCNTGLLGERVRVAFRADAGATLSAIRVRRLDL